MHRRSRRPRVLILDNAPYVGGVQVTLRNIAPRLNDSHFDVSIAVPAESRVGLEWYRGAGVSVLPVDLPSLQRPEGLLRGVPSLISLLRRERPHIVHANSTRAGLAAIMACRFTGTPLAWTIHEGNVPLPARLAAPFAGQVLYRSESQRAMYRWFSSSNMRLVYPGTPDESLPTDERRALRRAFRRELGFPEDCLLVGQVGTLCVRKGFDVFLRASKLIAEARADVRFVVIGGGSPPEPHYPRELRRLASELKLHERVAFAGFRADGVRLIGTFDLLSCGPWIG